MATIELIYDAECPNIEGARRHLRTACSQVGLDEHWREWDRANADSPGYSRRYGSPTILVDGQDIVGEHTGAGANCCRIYEDAEGKLSGVPSVEMIVRSLQGSNGVDPGKSAQGIQVMTLIPAIGAALLPKLTCPLCWPAYASLLSAAGLGFVDYTPYLLPLTSAFLLVAIASIGYHAKKKKQYAPLFVGMAAAVMVWAARFVWANDWMTYGGIAALVGASIWGTWPMRRSSTCSACA